MVKRLFDVALSAVALVLLSPLFLVAAAGILVSSPGPVLYRAKRVGLGGAVFTMFKFRTMHTAQHAAASPITAKHDPRVFPFGVWLRRLKVDELPQLVNVLKGEMAIVGPRPEDPQIVKKYYAAAHLETLRVRPGLASPGSIFNYTHGEQMLAADDSEASYAARLLPVKLALELVYVRERSFFYDLRIVLRTVLTIISIAAGRHDFPEPPEMGRARLLVTPAA